MPYNRGMTWEHPNFEENQKLNAFREQGTLNREKKFSVLKKYFCKYAPNDFNSRCP